MDGTGAVNKEQTALMIEPQKSNETEGPNDLSTENIINSDNVELVEKEESGGLCKSLIKSKSARFGVMLTFIVLYFLTEVIVGHITNSLTLVADSFHMLSDAVSLIVGLFAVRMSKRTAEQPLKPWLSKQSYDNTFGWVRFEVLGALVNSTFLLALCISILLEAIEKFSDTEKVKNPKLVLIVGAGGLIINIFGLIMFGSHAHAGHDHGHSHDDDDHEHNHTDGQDHEHNDDHAHSQNHTHNGDLPSAEEGKKKKKKQKKKVHTEEQLNMKAVFLHVLGDALGSVIVMISALVIWLVPEENTWTIYIDPGMSLLLVVIMTVTTIPLFKKSSMILLQTVPKHLKLDIIREKLRNIQGIKEIHDLHIWQLTGDKIVASVHVHCTDIEAYLDLAQKIKTAMHELGIHSTTVQPEFSKSDVDGSDVGCDMLCGEQCITKTCCGNASDKKLTKYNSNNTILDGNAAAKQSSNVIIEDDLSSGIQLAVDNRIQSDNKL